MLGHGDMQELDEKRKCDQNDHKHKEGDKWVKCQTLEIGDQQKEQDDGDDEPDISILKFKRLKRLPAEPQGGKYQQCSQDQCPQ